MNEHPKDPSGDLPSVMSTEVSVPVGAIRQPPPHLHVLPFYQRLAYSVGHVLNDLCAAMWFSYLLIYFHLVVKFDNVLAGYLMLVGQIADGLATPFVGLQSDKEDGFVLCRYGKRKTWHLVGTLCVIVSFPFLFIECLGCKTSHHSAQFVYYAAFIIIFQFGWASTQISHLSLIPELTPLSSERIELNAFRYAFTVASNICVYLLTWLLLGINGGSSSRLTPSDAPLFRNIVLIVVGIGILFSAAFHISVKERSQLPPAEGSSESQCDESLKEDLFMTYSMDASLHLVWTDWFKEPQFYLVGFLYMATRLYCNLTQVYIPLYIHESLNLDSVNIAIIPLVIYVSGFISSFFMKFVSVQAGTKLTYLIGGVLAMVATLWIFFGGKAPEFARSEIYAVATVIGVSTSTMLVTSLAITADLIAHNTSSGAFVYGSMSFMDKVSNGVAVVLVQYFHPCENCCPSCSWYYEHVLVYVCGASALLGLVFLATLTPYTIGNTRSKVLRRPAATVNRRHSSKVMDDCHFTDSSQLVQGETEIEDFGTIN